MPPSRASIANRLRLAWPWVAMLVAALYLYRVAGHFAYAPRPGELGPDVWPRAILVLLIVVCALRMAGYLLGRGIDRSGAALERGGATAAAGGGVTATDDVVAAAGNGATAEAGAESAVESAARYPRLLIAGVALTILYVLTMGTLGFFLATALYLALFMLVGRYRRPVVIAVSSVVGSLAFVYVFMKIVYVSLPLGIGPFEQLSLALLAAFGVR